MLVALNKVNLAEIRCCLHVARWGASSMQTHGWNRIAILCSQCQMLRVLISNEKLQNNLDAYEWKWICKRRRITIADVISHPDKMRVNSGDGWAVTVWRFTSFALTLCVREVIPFLENAKQLLADKSIIVIVISNGLAMQSMYGVCVSGCRAEETKKSNFGTI